MNLFVRRMPLLLGMLAAAACSGDDEPIASFEDDASAAIDAGRDGGAGTFDHAAGDTSDGASATDAPRDAGETGGDSGGAVDGGNRADSSVRDGVIVDSSGRNDS